MRDYINSEKNRARNALYAHEVIAGKGERCNMIVQAARTPSEIFNERELGRYRILEVRQTGCNESLHVTNKIPRQQRTIGDTRTRTSTVGGKVKRHQRQKIGVKNGADLGVFTNISRSFYSMHNRKRCFCIFQKYSQFTISAVSFQYSVECKTGLLTGPVTVAL